jgi:hypothetical protein
MVELVHASAPLTRLAHKLRTDFDRQLGAAGRPDDGLRKDAPTTVGRHELNRLRREDR